MAVIYLRHPIHGSKVASSNMEADVDKSHGWEEYDPNASVIIEEPEIVPPAPIAPPVVPVVPVVPVAPVAPAPAKPKTPVKSTLTVPDFMKSAIEKKD